MEHKLIIGGEIWLPFARSRIKALHALSKGCAAQKIVMPDGAMVWVSIDGGLEFIKIIGGAQSLEMDSGLVDLINTGQNNAHRYEPGVIKDVDSVTSYAAHFDKPSKDGKTFTYQAKESIGQLLGVISVGANQIAGRVWNDHVARCFETKKVLKNEVYVYAQEDADLYAKKYTAAWRPASNYTGKCRLYVQALYGAPLYRSNGTAGVKVCRYPQIDPSARTGLKIPRYKKNPKDDPDNAPDDFVRINTSTGVWTDAKGRHWLAQMGSENMAIYALKPSAAGKAARKWLSKLPEEDRDRLEAYILSTSLPVLESKQVIPLNPAVNGWAMSYGWHWAWSTPSADIVINDTYLQGIHDGKEWYAMRSTHYRLQLTQTETEVDGKTVISFSAAVSIVEGPKNWALNRIFWCIAEPGTTGMAKSTPKYTEMFACDAPFYAFYNRDVLKVCRVNVTTGVNANLETASSSAFGTIANWQTLGMAEGWAELQDIGSETFFTVKISVGSQVTPALVLNTTLSSRLDINGKTSEDVFVEYVGDGTIPSTYWPYLEGDPPWITVYDPALGLPQQGTCNVTYNNETSRVSREFEDLATVVVPFYDAEAIFVHYRQKKTEVRTDRLLKVYKTGNFVTIVREVHPDYINNVWLYGKTHRRNNNWGPNGGGNAPTLLSTTNPTNSTDVTEVSHTSLLTVHGTDTPNMDDWPPFHDPQIEETGAGYGVISGTRTATPVVISPGRITPVGTSTDATSDHALVGWV